MSSRIIFHNFCTDADDVSTRTNDGGAIGGLPRCNGEIKHGKVRMRIF
jgi:hypothetical protein